MNHQTMRRVASGLLAGTIGIASLAAVSRAIASPSFTQTVSSLSNLEAALQQQHWQQASDLTWARLEREVVSADGRAFRQFPCEELVAVDDLWRRASGDRYGFSVQRNLWATLARRYPRRDRTYEEFRRTVGWMDVPETNAYPVGYFPMEQFWETGRVLQFGCGDADCSFPRTEVEETRLALEYVFPRLRHCGI